ncbi:SMI1/KNR4 family protein [candidate division CSSED10-310 bacterium]|uniref:SMI1/KNR4 family protein n=1 Tax=candidate division CSSED10-310 bacterium TaxID=2855610 RepID=A0ABV6Z1I3_UNCC1
MPPHGKVLKAEKLAQMHYNAPGLSETLQKLEKWLQKHESPVVNALLPGLTPAEIQKLTKDFPAVLPRELELLYQWHNGTEANCELPLIWYHSFLNLEQALVEYKKLRRLSFITGWQKNWLPIFDFQGEYYFINCSTTQVDALPIFLYFDEVPEIEFSYLNLTTMMATGLKWYESEAAYLIDQEGFLGEDIQKLSKIHQQLNPGVRFPYHVP